ncbi:MAG: hypothetical protein DRI77_05870 [Chloroflexi bacterium]|nr:MAG: hypothetical protein DRI77_05870 [Chloroflexota bacterium]
MQTYHAETIVSGDGTLVIRGLPFRPGDKVKVTMRTRQSAPRRHGRYPLRGKPILYIAPFEDVAKNDWAVLK